MSTAPGNTGNLLEFNIPPGITGNLLKFNWSSWKIAKCWWQSWDSCSPSKLVGWHSDERWSKLIITCSVRDSSYIACRHNIISRAVTTLKPTESFWKCLLEVSWKSTGNVFSWNCRYPVFQNYSSTSTWKEIYLFISLHGNLSEIISKIIPADHCSCFTLSAAQMISFQFQTCLHVK